MAEELVQLQIEGEVATIFLNRPKRGNALTGEMQAQMLDILEKVRKDANVHVVVLTGKGKYFCTGMDLGASAQKSMQDNLEDEEEGTVDKGLKFFQTLHQFPKPVIAKVNGSCFGGGVGLLFCCDFRIMTHESFLCFSEVKRGIAPALISHIILPQCPTFQMKQYMLSGARIPAEEAHRLGFISTVVKPDQLDSEVDNCVKSLLSSAPQAMATIKQMIQFAEGHTEEENKKNVKRIFKEMMTSEEAFHGISSFAAKQKPDWSQFRAKL